MASDVRLSGKGVDTSLANGETIRDWLAKGEAVLLANGEATRAAIDCLAEFALPGSCCSGLLPVPKPAVTLAARTWPGTASS